MSDRKSQARSAVLTWMKEHEGSHHFTDVAQALDYPPTTVNAALRKCLDAGQGIVWVAAGTYRFQAPEAEAQTTGRLFTQVGTTASGALVLECEEGTLYRAEVLA